MSIEACDIPGSTWYLTWALAEPIQFAETLISNLVQLMNLRGQNIDRTLTNEFPWHYIIALEVESIL